MLRGWARGYRIGVYQFVKSGKWNVGEQKAAETLGNIDWFKMGDGWTWTSKDLVESADRAREGWEEVKRRLEAETYDMLQIGRAHSELQSRQYLVCRLLLEK